MKKNIFILCLLSAICFVSCQDDNDPIIETNPYGSTKVITGDYKVISYSISNKILALKEKLSKLDHHLYSIGENKEYTFDGRLVEVGEKLRVEMLIPLREVLADGEYKLSFSTKEEGRLVASFHITLANEMVAAVNDDKVDYSSKFKVGSGTESDPYIVKNLNTLFYLLHKDSLHHAAGLHFKQSDEFETIDMQGVDLEGRGHTAQPFAGHYDGNNVILNGLTHRGTSKPQIDCYAGLFSKLLDGAVVENITFNDVDIYRQAKYTGAVAGYSSGDVTLSNITLYSGAIDDCGSSIGGLIGMAEKGDVTIQDIYSTLNVKGEQSIGGLIGEANNAKLTIKRVTLSNRALTSGDTNIGGMIGYANNCSLHCDDISAVYRTDAEDSDIATLEAEGPNIGLLVGRLNHNESISLVKNISCQLPIHGKGFVGGLFGSVSGENGTIELKGINVTANHLTNSESYTGGIAGYWDGLNLKVDSVVMQAALKGNIHVGGLIGKAKNINWGKNSFNNIMISASDGITGSESVGGVFGTISNLLASAPATIPAHTKAFTISPLTSVNGTSSVGGFVGYAIKCHFEGDVDFDQRIITTDEITGKSLFSGKINDGSEYGDKATDVGGLFGLLSMCQVSGVMADGVVKGKENVGGIVGQAINTSLEKIARKGAEVKGIDGNTGGICGFLSSATKDLDLLVNFSKVTSNPTGNNTGGIIGFSDPSKITIKHAINRGDVTGGESIGGVIGKITTKEKGHNSTEMTRIAVSVNYGTITGTYKGGSKARGLGGIAGLIEYCVEIAYCANHGSVIAETNTTYNGVGGIAGVAGEHNDIQNRDNQISIRHCCNTATITSKMPNNNKNWTIGGVLGRLCTGFPGDLSSARIHNCYNTGAVEGDCENDNGGIVGTIENYGHVNECLNLGKVEYGNGGVGTHTGATYDINNVYVLKGSGKTWQAEEFTTSHKGKKTEFPGLTFSSYYWTIDESLEKNNGYPCLSDSFYQFRIK